LVDLNNELEIIILKVVRVSIFYWFGVEGYENEQDSVDKLSFEYS